jgi:hypothetical protein
MQYLLIFILFSAGLVRAEKQITQGFYVLFDYQVDNASFPVTVCQNDGIGEQGNECVDMQSYNGGIIIAQPMNLTSQHMKRIKEKVPGSMIFAYWCIDYVPIYTSKCSTGHIMGDRDGRNCSTTYKCTDGVTPAFNKLVNAAFPPSWAKTSLTLAPGDVYCGYKGQASYVMFDESAEALAKMLASVVLDNSFDGIYLDGYVDPSNYKIPKFPSGESYDFNNDGKPDSPEDVVKQYSTYTPLFVQRLRDLLGPSPLIIANSAGRNPDKNLNGLTIEMEACLSYTDCTSALQENFDVGAKPTVSALWLTHSESMPAEQQCATARRVAQEMPWVQMGTDFFDGSYILCDSPAKRQ